jgi:hypothetical protein
MIGFFKDDTLPEKVASSTQPGMQFMHLMIKTTVPKTVSDDAHHPTVVHYTPSDYIMF